LRRQNVWNLAPEHACFVQDGTLVAFARPSDAVHSTLYRIGDDAMPVSVKGPIMRPGDRSVVLPARSPDEVFITELDAILHLRIAGDRAKLIDSLPRPAHMEANAGQLFSLGDGRLVGPQGGKGLCVFAPGTPGVSYAMPKLSPQHLAAASAERLWYSHASTAEDWRMDVLVLARIVTPTVPEQRIELAPGRVVHLASGGGAVAALVVDARGSSALAWSVVVIDELGAQRWKAPVPSAFVPDDRGLNQGFVAISERRVVLARPDHALFAWDAITGMPIT
jgi:hypothetical protein